MTTLHTKSASWLATFRGGPADRVRQRVRYAANTIRARGWWYEIAAFSPMSRTAIYVARRPVEQSTRRNP